VDYSESPTTDEQTQLVPPGRVPPIFRGTLPPFGWGSRSPQPRQLWRLFALALILAVGASTGLVYITLAQPVLAVAGLIGSSSTLIVRIRFPRRHSERLFGYSFLAAILCGAGAEAALFLIDGLPPGAPNSPLWLLIGIFGVGGVFGLLATLAAGTAYVCCVLAWELYKGNRLARRAA
jgi:hypothetical protein